MSDKTPIEVEVKIPIKDFDELFQRLQQEGLLTKQLEKNGRNLTAKDQSWISSRSMHS